MIPLTAVSLIPDLSEKYSHAYMIPLEAVVQYQTSSD